MLDGFTVLLCLHVRLSCALNKLLTYLLNCYHVGVAGKASPKLDNK